MHLGEEEVVFIDKTWLQSERDDCLNLDFIAGSCHATESWASFDVTLSSEGNESVCYAQYGGNMAEHREQIESMKMLVSTLMWYVAKYEATINTIEGKQKIPDIQV